MALVAVSGLEYNNNNNNNVIKKSNSLTRLESNIEKGFLLASNRYLGLSLGEEELTTRF